nr:hypothetical protein [Bacillus infantis]
MVIVHEFAENVFFNKDSTHPIDNTAVVINFDGRGLDAIKRAEYNELCRSSRFSTAGSKCFINEPLMTPKDVLELDPASGFVIHQKRAKGSVPLAFLLEFYHVFIC